MTKDLYRLLGVSRKAKKKEIEKAYLKLARRIHPDVNPGDPQAPSRFREIQVAYRVLSSTRSRSLYDRKGEVDPSLGGEASATERRQRSGEARGWEHVLREAFQDPDMVDAGAGPVKGEDVHQVLEITFQESLRGAEREVAFQRDAVCGTCRGKRYAAGSAIIECPDCEGSGLVSVHRGPYTARKICPRCSGEGEVGTRSCPACGGRGRRPETARKKVNIEAGIDSGSTVVVPGEGQPGLRGGQSGNLVVTLKVQLHPHLERKGYNLYGSVPITVAEAALGATIMVPTAERKVSLQVPAGTQGGQQFRLQGRGVPLPGGERRGDLFITVNVTIPAADSQKARKLFREIGKLYPDNPRVRT